MNLAILSDTHGHHRKLTAPSGDIVIHCGDFSWKSNLAEIIDFLEWYSKLEYTHRVLVAGNHDRFPARHADRFLALIRHYGVIYLENSQCNVEGIKIYGSPFSADYGPAGAFMYSGETAGQRMWARIPENTDILVTHGPPYGFGDFSLSEGIHSGCRQLLQRIHIIKPAYHVFGHIHEGYGVYAGENTVFINASLTDRAENMVHRPIVVSL
jgi:Icc-related predicted phosphoesterase